MRDDSASESLSRKFSLSIEELSIPQVLGRIAAVSQPPSGRAEMAESQFFLQCSLSEDEISEALGYNYESRRLSFLRDQLSGKCVKLSSLTERVTCIDAALQKVQQNVKKLRLNQDILMKEILAKSQ